MCLFRPHPKTSHSLIQNPNLCQTEKHKTYHISNDLLARDGFKKFMKNEPCSFERCRFSLQSNHIHCIRDNCFYVLHSSGQMFSHKRKHERHDSEQAYQKYKLAQKSENAAGAADGDGGDVAGTAEPPASGAKHLFGNNLTALLSNYADNATQMESLLHGSDPMHMLQQLQLQKQAMLGERSASGSFERGGGSDSGDDVGAGIDNNNYDAADAVAAKAYGPNEPATDGRPINANDLEQLKHIYSAMERAKQKQISALLFAQNNFSGADQSEPLNLNLSAVVQKMHQNQTTQNAPSNLQQITSIDGLFNRKRGRPPKNRVVEVYGTVSTAIRGISAPRT